MTRKWNAKAERAKSKQSSNRTVARRIANGQRLTDDLSGNFRPETRTMSRGKDAPTMTAEPEAMTTPDEPTLTPLWTAVSPIAPWTNYRRGTIPLAVRRVVDRIELRGAVCGGRRGAPLFQFPPNPRPPGLTVRPIAVAGADGIATAIIDTSGLVTISTDNWSGGAQFWDLGLICFTTDAVLAEAIRRDAQRAGQSRSTRTENRNGVIVAAPS